MKTSEILIAARASIDTPEKLADNGPPSAAIRACARTLAGKLDAYLGLVQVRVGGWPKEANPPTHADVMAAFDRAIAAEQAKETVAP